MTPTKKASNALIAAGAVLLRPGVDQRLETLLVHGKSHDPAFWGFPKGHQKPGEAIEMTALREVREETGFQVHLLGIAALSRYEVLTGDGSLHDKTVTYFLAHPVGGDLRNRDAEYALVAWKLLEEAQALLTYENDRKVLREALRLLKGMPLYQELLRWSA
jgi:8-oxo-dGTP diphosphatase